MSLPAHQSHITQKSGGTPNLWAVIVSFSEFILVASIPLCQTAWKVVRRKKKSSKLYKGSKNTVVNSHVPTSFQKPSYPIGIKLCGFAGTMNVKARSTRSSKYSSQNHPYI